MCLCFFLGGGAAGERVAGEDFTIRNALAMTDVDTIFWKVKAVDSMVGMACLLRMGGMGCISSLASKRWIL